MSGLFCMIGCDYLFQLDHVDPRDGGDGGDGASDGDVVVYSACTNPLFTYRFTEPIPCTPWGAKYEDYGATVSQDGKLVITAAPQTNSIGGCDSPSEQFEFIGSINVVVSEILKGSSTYTVLTVHGPNLQIKGAGNNTVRFQDTASNDKGFIAYDPGIKWWRIRAMGSSTIIGEVSRDGSMWTELGRVAMTVPSMIGIELSAGTNTASVSGKGTFELLQICPP